MTYPRARGGDPLLQIDGQPLPVLIPAHAGVIPDRMRQAFSSSPYPRARGGDPIAQLVAAAVGLLSPRTRG